MDLGRRARDSGSHFMKVLGFTAVFTCKGIITYPGSESHVSGYFGPLKKEGRQPESGLVLRDLTSGYHNKESLRVTLDSFYGNLY